MSSANLLGQKLAHKMRARADVLGVGELELLKWGMKYVPHYFNKPFSRAHHVIGSCFDQMKKSRGKKTVIMMPRGYAKSTISSFLAVLKAVCEGSERYILLGADTVKQAGRYLDSISAELTTNDLIKKDYPTACTEGSCWNKERIETGNNVCVEIFGKGTNVRGAKFKQFRPTLVILDDPQSDDDVNSVTTREKDLEWFVRTLEPVGDTETNFLIIGNNLHRESIVGRVGGRSDFKKIKFSAIEEWPDMQLWDEWASLYHQEAPLGEDEQFDINNVDKECNKFYAANEEKMLRGSKVLWPEKDTLLQLMIIRENLGHSAFDAEKQNNPRDPSRHEFEEAWFQGEDIFYDKLPEDEACIKVGFCDPAKGIDSKKRDFSAIITFHFATLERKCYVEVDMKRRPVTNTIDKIIEMNQIRPYLAFGMESNGFQFLMSDELFSRAMEDGGTPINVVPVDNHGVHKNTRISRLAIWHKRRFFKYKRHCKDTKILLQQWLDHPHSDHDDGPDGQEGAIRILTSYVNLGSIVKTPDAEVISNIYEDGVGDNLCD